MPGEFGLGLHERHLKYNRSEVEQHAAYRDFPPRRLGRRALAWCNSCAKEVGVGSLKCYVPPFTGRTR